ncbi:MAG TPA: acetyl-CoA carboxylase biotin carboxylase subunit [Mycobacteriales bacterium]|nr:acetyl-CoA carboxylase biotin carboxylase subunit [Mycobacteriales bacterium]
MFTKILIANRGEIAVRVARTCRELGIATVAVYSTADRASSVVRMADESVHIGPAAAKRSYLSMPAVIEAARTTGAQAIHPGYGFLSENPDFAEVCADNDLVFIGPRPEVMRTLGDKALTRAAMLAAGLPLLPGTVAAVATAADAYAAAEQVGYPVILKAVAGGGGRGMTVVRHGRDLVAAFQQTRAAAATAFGDGRVYLERYLPDARHVEVQVLCDQHGNGVYLGDRDCSTQRRHQKLIEEAPAPNLSDRTRAAMGAASVQGALHVGFSGAGTMEFLLDGAGEFYLMEMNARLQVEHPVTEMITGLDLVEQQILVAAGEPLRFGQPDVTLRGAAIECRINAEDPEHGFRPTPGTLDRFVLPGGPFTRVDTHAFPGYPIPPDYDSLLAKVVVWAPDRAGAVARARRALCELVVAGPQVRTTAGFAAEIVDHPLFRAAQHTTDLVERVFSARQADRTKETQMKSTTNPALDTGSLRDILVSEVGIDGTRLAEQPQSPLADLGLDSMAQVELGVILQNRHGVGDLPHDASTMSFGELSSHLCGLAA